MVVVSVGPPRRFLEPPQNAPFQASVWLHRLWPLLALALVAGAGVDALAGWPRLRAAAAFLEGDAVALVAACVGLGLALLWAFAHREGRPRTAVLSLCGALASAAVVALQALRAPPAAAGSGAAGGAAGSRAAAGGGVPWLAVLVAVAALAGLAWMARPVWPGRALAGVEKVLWHATRLRSLENTMKSNCGFIALAQAKRILEGQEELPANEIDSDLAASVADEINGVIKREWDRVSETMGILKWGPKPGEPGMFEGPTLTLEGEKKLTFAMRGDNLLAPFTSQNQGKGALEKGALASSAAYELWLRDKFVQDGKRAKKIVIEMLTVQGSAPGKRLVKLKETIDPHGWLASGAKDVVFLSFDYVERVGESNHIRFLYDHKNPHGRIKEGGHDFEYVNGEGYQERP
jgi:hypothetical protein